ncbi:chemotaxis protein CheA [Nocardioides sp. TRM66260-LWL]|uniref:chemotaxis protein CheA n=1 Tax=Nocardioides sp. TRM66260-LWL TaxID=2874478 RepID=UPI001CC700B6|nr:chemotaxis protein CheA [Nocardioides sp. TRM66260-LWL]MBZ5736158.1 chemotaxis protein CheA [Nocardioides sp. TRM66260-LWL]
MSEDAEIVAEFLVESHENLDQLDRDLVELEQSPGSRELLSSIFRTIHTIKGTSGFLAFSRLERLTHVGENLLSRLRDGKMTMDADTTGVLLRMVDTVRALLEAIESEGTDTAPSVPVDDVVAELEETLAGRPRSAAPAAPEPVVEQPVVEPVPVVEPQPEPEAVVEPAAPAAAPEPAPAKPAAKRTARPAAKRTAKTPAAKPEATTPAAAAPTAPAPQTVETPAAAVAAPPAAEAPEHHDEDGVKRGVVDSSVRVDIDLLDGLVQLVGELVLTRNQILQRTETADDVELLRAAQRLDLVASELQESVMRTRMQPIGQVWSKMPRIVRDLAHQLGREVNLEMEGHETELDRSLLEALKGPLTHLVRNSLDHGIEPPADRAAAGKPAQGRLALRAFHESGQVVVEITDDGRGMDPDKIAAAAVARGVVSREAITRMETREILELIFRPGFSTAEQVTNVSGRGVGMDVVRTSIERIGGSVDITSVVGAGTTVRVRIPLTLAIIPALVVGESGERYAIPQANLVELVRLEGSDLRESVEVLAGAPVLRLRGRLLPLVTLGEALGGDPLRLGRSEALTIVVVQADDTRFGLCVAEVHDTQEIVVKPIGRQLKALPMYAGATIMGDGRVALILDVAGIARDRELATVVQPVEEHRSGLVDSRALLVLEVASGRRAALPLTAVSRLEEFEVARVERSGSAEVVQYRDGILPLVRLASAIGLVDSSQSSEQISVVVHEEEAGRVGIVIDKVLDVVEEAVVPTEVGKRPGVLGSAVVQDRVTDLVDLDAVVAPILAGAR